MVILVTGSSGQLGQSLQSIEKNYPEFTFVFCNSSQLDITNLANCKAVFEQYKPNYCINAAAYTAVDKAESEPENAYLVNVTGVKNIATICKEYQTTLLHISTDFVFDGTSQTPYKEDHPTNPINIYGKTKLEGEQAIQRILNNYYIIRTSWVYSEFGNNFMKTMLRLASEKDTISVVNDQIGCPTNAVDLTKILLDIIKKDNNKYGIYHFSNQEVCSWYDFAKNIFDKNNINVKLLPIPTTQFPTPAKRPAYSVLDNSKLQKILMKL